jgi:lipoprotein-releasing system ATP-binding protein
VVYVIILASAFAILGEVYGDLLRAAGATERLMELLATQSPIESPANPLPAPVPAAGSAIVFEAVQFHYPSRPLQPALVDFTLAVEPGQTVAIVGPSGAGKSTLLHIIGTLDRPTVGRVLINGIDVSALTDRELSRFRSRSIGFIFQMHNLLPEFSAIENVMMPGIIAGMRISDLRDRAAGLLASVGLESRLNHKPGELSGGEQQRVAIARALFMAPPLLVADEPTGNLDRRTSIMIQDLLLELVSAQKMTLVLVTHDMELAARLPSQIVMEDGEIIRDEVVH